MMMMLDDDDDDVDDLIYLSSLAARLASIALFFYLSWKHVVTGPM